MPIAVLSAVWLQRDRPWGFILAGYTQVKAAMMGLALLSMTWFLRAGFSVDSGLAVFWTLLTIGSLGMSVFLRHCRRRDARAGGQ